MEAVENETARQYFDDAFTRVDGREHFPA